MLSSQACSVFRSHQRLSTCHWAANGRPLTNQGGRTPLEESSQSSAQLLIDKRAHPKWHLLCALFATALFCPTGVLAVFYALKSLSCERHGYYEQALIHSSRSFAWLMTTFVIALFTYLTIGLFIFISTPRRY